MYQIILYFSEESNFIEISVDPNSIQPDEELFPVSVFTQIKESSSRDRGESQSIVGSLTESWQIPESEDTSSSNSTRDEDVLTIPDDNEFEGMNHVGFSDFMITIGNGLIKVINNQSEVVCLS